MSGASPSPIAAADTPEGTFIADADITRSLEIRASAVTASEVLTCPGNSQVAGVMHA
jgi:hypothetical protein